MMQDKQDLIIQHNFTYHLPKVSLDKFRATTEEKNPGGGKGGKGGKYKSGQNEGKFGQDKIKSMKDMILHRDPSHMRWCIQRKFFQSLLLQWEKVHQVI
jgi:hypothetical protein